MRSCSLLKLLFAIRFFIFHVHDRDIVHVYTIKTLSLVNLESTNKRIEFQTVSYTHLTLPTIYSV